jgi:hypothetical protein
MVEEFKIHWIRLWQERLNANLSAEDMAINYCDIFIERVEAICMTTILRGAPK